MICFIFQLTSPNDRNFKSLLGCFFPVNIYVSNYVKKTFYVNADRKIHVIQFILEREKERYRNIRIDIHIYTLAEIDR